MAIHVIYIQAIHEHFMKMYLHMITCMNVKFCDVIYTQALNDLLKKFINLNEIFI